MFMPLPTIVHLLKLRQIRFIYNQYCNIRTKYLVPKSLSFIGYIYLQSRIEALPSHLHPPEQKVNEGTL